MRVEINLVKVPIGVDGSGNGLGLTDELGNATDVPDLPCSKREVGVEGKQKSRPLQYTLPQVATSSSSLYESTAGSTQFFAASEAETSRHQVTGTTDKTMPCFGRQCCCLFTAKMLRHVLVFEATNSANFETSHF